MGHDLPPLPLRDVHTVRWYVLSLPACHKGPAKGLRKELDRRVRLGEPTFDFFAPSFVEMHRREGRLVETHRPLLYNYVFIRRKRVICVKVTGYASRMVVSKVLRQV